MLLILPKSVLLNAFLTGLTLLPDAAVAQLRILSPPALATALPGGQGKVEASTATFGAPFFGDRVIGRLLWTESKGGNYCSAEDYDVPARRFSESGAFLSSGGGSASETSGALIDVIVVRRGGCPFTKKVQIAQDKGAHAVIIVDKEDSPLTQADMPRIIVADDGNGVGVHIPSILVPKDEGARLIAAISEAPVVVELKWNIPTDHVVQMDLWMSSGSQESMQFLKEFSTQRKALNRVVRFRPHYSVFSMPSPDSKLCLDDAGQYCAEDPDAEGPVTGREVLLEDVRQLCVHDMTKQPRTTVMELQAGKPLVEFAQTYWEYVEAFVSRCPLNGTETRSRFGTPCAEKVLAEVGMDVDAVRQCVVRTQETKLNSEKRNVAWSPRALRINGWRYTGMMNADLVTRAVCSGFLQQPSECQEILAPRDPFAKYTGVPDADFEAVSLHTFIIVLSLVIIISCLLVLLYKRSFKNQVHRAIREEVMLEVQQQMSYTKMHADL